MFYSVMKKSVLFGTLLVESSGTWQNIFFLRIWHLGEYFFVENMALGRIFFVENMALGRIFFVENMAFGRIFFC